MPRARMRCWTVMLLGCCLVSSMSVTWAQEEVVKTALGPPYVRINGEIVGNTPGILVVGIVLLPVEDLFGVIGGQATRDPALPKYTIRRGDVTIELTLDTLSYQVGDQELGFSVAPVQVGRVIYVSVADLVQDALGGTYRWDPATLTADVQIEVLGLGGDAIQGALLLAHPGPPARLLVKTDDAPYPTLYEGASTVEYLLKDIDGKTRPSTIEELREGEGVELGLNRDGEVVKVLATRSEVEGEIAWIAASRIWLKPARQFGIAADVQVVADDGQPYDISSLARGDQVRLTVNPADGTALKIVVTRAAATADAPAGPTITLVSPTAYEGPLKADGRLHVRLRGTPGGSGSFDIGDGILGLRLTEPQPGDYRGHYTAKPGDNVTDEPIVGHLIIDDREAPVARSEQLVTLDTTPPVFLEMSPHYGKPVETSAPTLEVKYGDGEGSGVDPAQVSLKLDGADITDQAVIDDTTASYQAADLAQGFHLLQIVIADRAGNPAQLPSVFEVVKAAHNKIVSVRHDGRGILVAGDRLTISMEVEEVGRRAHFVIGKNWREGEMRRVANANTYQAHYTVKRDDDIRGAKITGHFTDNAGATHEMKTTNKVYISADLPDKLAITSPEDGDEVAADTFEVSGQAPPQRDVRVIVQYEFLGTHNLSVQTLKADPAGQWKTKPIDRQAKWLASIMEGFTIVAQLLDAEGNPEETQQINIRVPAVEE